jgi:protein-S-isoprenylcysteine O-methyltransferase Ste14
MRSELWALVQLGVFLSFIYFRALHLGSQGVPAFRRNLKNFIVALPFVLGIVYCITAPVFDIPIPKFLVFTFFNVPSIFVGLGVSGLGLCGLAFSWHSFGTSLRTGFDDQAAAKLITTGPFGVSRNPIYVCFITEFLSVFLMVPTVAVLIFVTILVVKLHLQILREEAFLKSEYGDEYVQYSKNVPRYLGWGKEFRGWESDE